MYKNIESSMFSFSLAEIKLIQFAVVRVIYYFHIGQVD